MNHQSRFSRVEFASIFKFPYLSSFLPIVIAGQIGAPETPLSQNGSVNFAQQVKPLLEQSCLGCHGPERPKSRFRVDSRDLILRGGSSGEPAIVPGESERSPLVRYVAGLIEEMEMPPLDSREKYAALSMKQIMVLSKWIDEGAVWPEAVILSLPAAARSVGVQPEQHAAEGAVGGIAAFFSVNDTNALADLLDQPSLLNLQDGDGNTPLMHSAFYLDAKALSALLTRGADPNIRNKAGTTALMLAVGSVEKVRLLLEHGADPNAWSKAGNTALIVAAYQYGSSPVLKELIKKGARVNVANTLGATALYAAAQAGDPNAIRTLLKHDADVNSKGPVALNPAPVTALMAAALHGHLDCVRVLIENGAEVHWVSEYGNVLNFATFTDRKETARLLLAKGVDVNVAGRRIGSARGDTGLTPLIYASMSERNDASLVELLLENGANPAARASSGETALSVARQRGDTKIADALLKAGTRRGVHAASEPLERKRLWQADQVSNRDERLLREASEKALSVLLRSGQRFTEATANRCSTCHQQSQPALAFKLAREKSVSIDTALAADQLQQTLVRVRARGLEAVEQPFPVPAIPAWLLIGLHASDVIASGATDRYVYSLARSQHKDGSWITRASRAPTDYADITSTAIALRALDLYAPPALQAELATRIAAAGAWLRKAQAVSTEERGYQLLGLHWSGAEPTELAQFSSAFLAEQRPDGGWAQLPTLETDAYATGLALFAMTSAGAIRPDDAAYQKGVEFLLNEQLDDGSWFVRTRASPVQVAIDEIFPHGEHQWISSVATTWSSIALMLPINASARTSEAAVADR